MQEQEKLNKELIHHLNNVQLSLSIEIGSNLKESVGKVAGLDVTQSLALAHQHVERIELCLTSYLNTAIESINNTPNLIPQLQTELEASINALTDLQILCVSAQSFLHQNTGLFGFVNNVWKGLSNPVEGFAAAAGKRDIHFEGKKLTLELQQKSQYLSEKLSTLTSKALYLCEMYVNTELESTQLG